MAQWWRIHLQCRRCKRSAFYPWIGKIPWSRNWQPKPVFLPGKSHGQRSLAVYSPWSCKTVGHNLVTKQTKSTQIIANLSLISRIVEKFLMLIIFSIVIAFRESWILKGSYSTICSGIIHFLSFQIKTICFTWYFLWLVFLTIWPCIDSFQYNAHSFLSLISLLFQTSLKYFSPSGTLKMIFSTK